ncbi:acyl-CoA dehydrogenase family protein [Saccharopolyspora gregorii]|uniref:acyl-CoA dehydrogenase family protein n=1 Tax=Saccharopolyspora gregorii TaxID=33914 RepID=UPI0021ABAD1F|nr:acyl-CoA dehydrogenase family protein [Saccharopolyspora gregorii]
MHFAFSAQQEDLRLTVRALLDQDGGPHVPAPPPAPAPLGHDPELWRRLGAEIGAAGLTVPEEHGGSGATLVESCLVAEELGRRLVPSPFVGGTALAVEALLTAGDSAAAERLLPGIAAADRLVALAWAEPENWWQDTGFATTARLDAGTWRLDGRKSFVLDGARADAFLVVATAPDGPALFEAAAEPAAVLPHPVVDPTRPMCALELSAAPAAPIGPAGPVLARCRDAAAVLLAAECVGAADRWLGEIVGYVQTRVQFGRPIGSFQAIKHRLADLYVAVESARSLSYAASWAVGTRDERGSAWAAMAKSLCCETYQDVAAEGIQLHGGLGITWEHEAHLHLKRAHGAAHLFGTPRSHRRRLEALHHRIAGP